MNTIVNLYSPKKGEISRFLNSYYNKEVNIENDLKWENTYENPIGKVPLLLSFCQKEN